MEYIASLSYGKDSIAMLEIIARHQMQLDRIVHVEVMATKDVPADLPEVIEWKKYADKIILKRYGICVEHISSDKSFEDLFYRIPNRRSFNRDLQGIIRGFPALGRPWCSKELKVQVMRNLYRGSVQYIGIAKNESERHSQLTDMVRSPLVEQGVTEAECMDICTDLGLVAPTYLQSKRNGCWFCPFQPYEQLRLLRKQHPELWEILLRWDMDATIPFKRVGSERRKTTVADFDRRFQLEDDGVIQRRGNKFTDFGMAVKSALYRQGKTQIWLIDQISKKTGLFVDNGYLYKILTGQRNAPKVVQAIREILELPAA